MSQAEQIKTRANTAPRNGLSDLLPQDPAIIRLLVLVVVLFAVFSIANPTTFPTGDNVRSMARQSSEIGILAIAVAITMLTGGIDLSINSTANLTGISMALILTELVPDGATGGQVVLGMTLGIGAALLVGLLCGLFNGLLIAYVGIPPILATLGTLTLFEGISTALTRGASVFGTEASKAIGNAELPTEPGIPIPLVLLLGVALVIGVILRRTQFGFETYLLGTNPTAARFSGINSRRILLRVYAVSGVLSAIAGIIILGRTNAAAATFGQSYVLLAIVIAVLGGIDPAGGAGRITGVVLAVFALQFLSTGLNGVLREFSGANFFKEFAWGLTLLVVLLGNYFGSRRRSKRKRT